MTRWSHSHSQLRFCHILSKREDTLTLYLIHVWTFTITIIKHLTFYIQMRCKDWFDVLNTKVTQKSRKSMYFAFTTPRLPREALQNMVEFGIKITFRKMRGLVLFCSHIHKNNFTWCILVDANKKAARFTVECWLRLITGTSYLCYRNQNTVFGYKKGLKNEGENGSKIFRIN